ncbi:MAG: hypothetical protein ACOYMR_01920 [Ilumatobacteraceae bacterium]
MNESIDVEERGSRAALAGVVFAALHVTGWVMMQQGPSVGASNEELIAHYGDPDSRRVALIAALWVLPFTAIAFVWFAAALRDRFVGRRHREHTLLATVHLLSAALFVVSIFTVAATELALVWAAENNGGVELDPDSVRTMVALGQAMASLMALRSAAVFVLITTTRARRAGLFPNWYSAFSYLAAVVLLVVFDLWPPIQLLMPLWVLATSVVVLKARTLKDLPTGA